MNTTDNPIFNGIMRISPNGVKTAYISHTSKIYDLAIILEVEYIPDIDIYELWKLCMNKLIYDSNYNKFVIHKEPPNSNVQNNKLIPDKYTIPIKYIYRKKSNDNSNDSGDIYTVIKDTNSKIYAVPYDFSDNYIPIYNSKFKELSQMYYIEGPAIFESEEPNTFITSDSYILVKYLDSDRQKQTFFKEGVNKKFVKENSLKDFDACSRFKD